MNKKKKYEQGLSLVELLAVIVILSLIFLLVTPIIVKSIENYGNIKADTILRDEADLILASIYRALYTTKESEISELKLENKIQDNVFNDSYLLMNDATKTGFKNGEFLLNDQPIKTSNKNIKIITVKDNKQNFSKLENIEKGVYRITLVLKNERKNLVRTFENEIVTIQDQKENKEETH